MTTKAQSLHLGKQVVYNLLKIFCFFSLLTNNLFGATINVGPPPGGNIQTAINGANDGDTIQLSAGTYVQQVQVISKSLDIVGAGQDLTIIQAPGPSTHLSQNFNFGANFWCIVMVDNQAAPTPQTVTISKLTVDGDSQQDTVIQPIYGSSDRFFAIGYHNASGTIQNVHTTNTKQSANFNELAGGGIVNASNNGNVTFNVTNCLIDFYQRQGIDCRGATLTANILNSTINRGYVLSPNTITATPNGIQFSGGSTGSIVNNVVENNIATVLNASATGLIPFGAGENLLISGNTLNNNDIGIAAIACGNNLIIEKNTFNFTTTPGVNADEGILVQDTNGLTTLTSNIMNNIPNVNMELISFINQPFNLMSNQFIGSQTGLRLQGSANLGPIVTMNNDSFSGTLGYYIEEINAPNDIWPSTASVSFDGLVSGNMTFMEYLMVQAKILGKLDDPALGLVLDFIPPIPVVTKVDPSFGPAAGGNTILITGANFFPGTTVNFGSNPGTNVMILSRNSLTVTVPPGVGTVDVTVTNSYATSPTTAFDRYSYTPLVPPTITNLTPNFGPTTGGRLVLITGTGFMTDNTLVFFGSMPATNVVVRSSSLLIVIAPPGVVGVVDVTVVTSMGQSAITPADQFTYIEPPPPPPPPIVNPLPPTHFVGVIRKNKFATQTEYVLQAKWDPSPSPNVILYRIFKHGKLIEEVPAGSDLFFVKHVNPNHSLAGYEIAAVNSNQLESVRLRLKVIQK